MKISHLGVIHIWGKNPKCEIVDLIFGVQNLTFEMINLTLRFTFGVSHLVYISHIWYHDLSHLVFTFGNSHKGYKTTNKVFHIWCSHLVFTLGYKNNRFRSRQIPIFGNIVNQMWNQIWDNLTKCEHQMWDPNVIYKGVNVTYGD